MALSPREVEVLQAASLGKTAKGTGILLGVSTASVNLYLRNAMLKLKADTKTEAVAIALRAGLIK